MSSARTEIACGEVRNRNLKAKELLRKQTLETDSAAENPENPTQDLWRRDQSFETFKKKLKTRNESEHTKPNKLKQHNHNYLKKPLWQNQD